MKAHISYIVGVLPLNIDTSSLAAGSHTFTIVATGVDGATNSFSLTLNIVRSLIFACTASQSGSDLSLECNSDRDVSTLELECQLDGDAFTPCEIVGVNAPASGVFMHLFLFLPRRDPCGD